MTPSDSDEVGPAEPAPHPPAALGFVASSRDFLVQLVIVTAGVLIALFFQGLVDSRRDQVLVREARGLIRQEIEDNRRELETEIGGLDKRKSDLENCLKFADDILKTGKTDIKSIDLGVSLAELSSASWQTAERTGALALMEYRDVQSLSKLYDAQALYVSAQRRSLERVASALTGVTDDATKAARADLEAFRHEVLALRALLFIEGQIAVQLSRSYKDTVAEVFE